MHKVSDFLTALNKVKPQLLAMNGGAEYFVKLNYSMQIMDSYVKDKNTFYKLSTKHNGPNGELEEVYYDELLVRPFHVIGGVAAGAVIGSWFPGLGNVIGAVIGGAAGLYECFQK